MPDVNDRPRVLITGAAGAIGSAVIQRLSDRWHLRATDLRATDPQSADQRATDLQAAVAIEALDITDADACHAAFAGIDAIVHLAGNPSPDANWSQLHAPNVTGTYVVAAAARDCGVPRLVLASSQQAVGAYPDTLQRRADDPPRPANLYGATKAWAEALGSWVASTSDTSVVALRIGFFAEHPPVGDLATPRNLAAWLSHDDAAELIRAAVEADVTGLTVVNGISANRYREATLDEAEHLLGYHPTDDAWSTTD